MSTKPGTVQFAPDLGPHTKYFHALTLLTARQALVTADDDIVYPRKWLARLLTARETDPTAIWCYRARVVGLDGSTVEPYASWPLAGASEPVMGLFFTGVGGAAYPTSMIQGLLAAGDRFVRDCPRADDVWVNHIARQLGVPVGLVGGISRGQLAVARSQVSNLTEENVHQGGNDSVIARLGFAACPDLGSHDVVR